MLFKIVMTTGRVSYDYMCGLGFDQAQEICEGYNWEWMDENGFVWDLEIEEDCELVAI